jgi:hypothetical protein
MARELTREEKNALCDRIDAIPHRGDSLAVVKAMVAETLKAPGVTEQDRIEVLTAMENGGYEALAHKLLNTKIPADFDPKNRPWNRN